MKRLIIVFLLIYLISADLRAQSPPDWTNQYPSTTAYGRSKIPLESIQGSPYLDNIFRKGLVITAEDLVYKDVPMRYNCFLDIIEFQKENKSYDIIPKSKIKRAEFGWQKYRYDEFKSVKGYFGILAEGHATLLVRYSIKFFEPGPVQGFSEASPASFDDLEETFYISIKDGPLAKINNSKKLLEVLNDRKDEVKTYISKLRLSTDKSEDMKRIINYYNTL
jgi:hypothetical protein